MKISPWIIPKSPTASFFKQDIATPPSNVAFSEQHFEESLFTQETRQTVAALDEIQSDFDQVTRKIHRPELSNADTRFPSYVLFTSRKNLATKYGENTAQVIIDSIKSLSAKYSPCLAGTVPYSFPMTRKSVQNSAQLKSKVAMPIP